MMTNHKHLTAILQIGTMNVLAISGGRARSVGETLVLPVSNGYVVEIDLDEGSDTYTVRRVFVRGGQRFVKGEQDYVHCWDLGEAAYRASCFRSDNFPVNA